MTKTTPIHLPPAGSICDKDTFEALASHANWVPVWATVPADLLTPVSAFWKLGGALDTKGGKQKQHAQPFSFLFESVEGGEAIARYTFLGTGVGAGVASKQKSATRQLVRRKGSASPLIMKFYLDEEEQGKSRGGQIEIWEHGVRSEARGEFIPVAREKFAQFVPAKVDGLPPLTAGAVGYMGYDLISLQEPVKLRPLRGGVAHPGRAAGMPDAMLMLFSTLLIFDHVKHQIWIVSNVYLPPKSSRRDIQAAYESGRQSVAEVIKSLDSPANPPAYVPEAASAKGARVTRLAVKSNTSREKFVASVVKAKQHIKSGDIFQVVLSQRLETAVKSHPFEIYRALRRVNPAPYLFYLQMGTDCILGSSPEMLVKVNGDGIEYRPIAGTRKRGATPEQDALLEQELLADEKELAEHTMLVDLGRNDVGRVATYGSVRPAKLKFIERYSHVMHMVSSIEGKLRPGLDAWDALLACFPAGTVTGAPKVRAMQIISELEPTRRGIYAGTVLYYDLTGDLNSCIAIRSIVVRDGRAVVQVGAGIVADSVPEMEYEETMNKGRGMLAAIAIAEQQTARRGTASHKAGATSGRGGRK